jgi:hypothetical protein
MITDFILTNSEKNLMNSEDVLINSDTTVISLINILLCFFTKGFKCN